jgi:hypothetical protein
MGLEQPFVSRYSKHIAAVTGLLAVAMMVTFTVASGDFDGSQQHVVAGSGSGAAVGVYTQPSVAGMNLGATVTQTTPGQAPVTEKAVPAH